MKTFILVLSLFFGLTLHAKKTHRQHSVHKHGAGTLGIAFDGKNGKLEFKIPSDSIFGISKTP